MPNDHILEFARFLAEHQVPVWIRHVLVPGISDIDADLTALGTFIGTLANVQKVEVLPYHKARRLQMGSAWPGLSVKRG